MGYELEEETDDFQNEFSGLKLDDEEVTEENMMIFDRSKDLGVSAGCDKSKKNNSVQTESATNKLKLKSSFEGGERPPAMGVDKNNEESKLKDKDQRSPEKANETQKISQEKDELAELFEKHRLGKLKGYENFDHKKT